MEIQELGALGELVGGVAVIATLVYLAVQTRHSANEARRRSRESAFRFPRQLSLMTETRENVDVLREGLKDFDSLPPELAGKFNSLMLGLFVAIVTALE
jgi:hypothetical protein